MKVLVAHRDRLVAEALAVALTRARLEPLDSYPVSGIEALREVEDKRPDVAVVDDGLRGMSGLALTRFVAERRPGTAVVLVTDDPSDRAAAAAGAGAAAVVSRAVTVAELRRRVLDARRLPALAPPRRGDDPLARIARLTVRELEVLDVLGSGIGADAIAAYLGISPATLKTHLARIFAKLGAGSQIEALALARRCEVIER